MSPAEEIRKITGLRAVEKRAKVEGAGELRLLLPEGKGDLKEPVHPGGGNDEMTWRWFSITPEWIDMLPGWSDSGSFRIRVEHSKVAHPAGWRDDEGTHDEPASFSAATKRKARQQLIDATSNKPGALEAIEWFGSLGELDPGKPEPAFLEREGNREACFELIAPRSLTLQDTNLSGFLCFMQFGQGSSFEPAFTALLLSRDHRVSIEISCPLRGAEALKNRYGLVSRQDVPEKARHNYELLKKGFPGEEFRDLRSGLALMEAVARSIQWIPDGLAQTP